MEIEKRIRHLEKELAKDRTLLDFAIGDDALYIGIQEVIFQEEEELLRLKKQLKEQKNGNKN